MIKNNKGSGLTWAIMLVMILLLIVGASLTFAYSSYNRSINNRNQLQCDLYAKSALDALTNAIREGNNLDVFIPENDKETIDPVIELPDAKGNISLSRITKVQNNLIKIEITYNYNDCQSSVSARMKLTDISWNVIDYDGGETS